MTRPSFSAAGGEAGEVRLGSFRGHDMHVTHPVIVGVAERGRRIDRGPYVSFTPAWHWVFSL